MPTNETYLEKLSLALEHHKEHRIYDKQCCCWNVNLKDMCNDDLEVWFVYFFKFQSNKNWLENTCQIKVKGRGQKRMLILSNDSRIPLNKSTNYGTGTGGLVKLDDDYVPKVANQPAVDACKYR